MRANSTNPDNLGADLSISRILFFNCYARVCMAVCARHAHFLAQTLFLYHIKIVHFS